jgi:hypothetical protein
LIPPRMMPTSTFNNEMVPSLLIPAAMNNDMYSDSENELILKGSTSNRSVSMDTSNSEPKNNKRVKKKSILRKKSPIYNKKPKLAVKKYKPIAKKKPIKKAATSMSLRRSPRVFHQISHPGSVNFQILENILDSDSGEVIKTNKLKEISDSSSDSRVATRRINNNTNRKNTKQLINLTTTIKL